MPIPLPSPADMIVYGRREAFRAFCGKKARRRRVPGDGVRRDADRLRNVSGDDLTHEDRGETSGLVRAREMPACCAQCRDGDRSREMTNSAG